ncbi:RNA methyltransferase [[Clostridium] symbiosum]|uniref:TrmH family RNA methyltransferase n=1 Tax=Clostridium symbiosum TaxID=1512 RepID=UPI001D0794D0|nr:RNA methyltransferase [[Clostridium] symbiosum]MCB6611320.1 RNA methyltransferase [[Clostridium] symbiosum]MCB6931145.1 RNA methyltransferase [[Clostridium] symbiosum]
MITSTGNNHVRAVSSLVKKAKARREQGLFIVEGAKMFSELPKEKLKETYVSESFLRQHGEKAAALLRGIHYEEVSDDVMKYMSDTQTPQGILAVAEQFYHTLEEVLERGGEERGNAAHLMILETIQDPGNLGTILRAGEGAGITGVVMNSATADIYNPKVIRSTMGSIYRVPFVYVDDLEKALVLIKSKGIRLYAAHLKGTGNYEDEDYRKDTGFLIGNEANGLTEETAAMADCYVKIPMAGKVESLNAAVAASVLMFEAARQRRN